MTMCLLGLLDGNDGNNNIELCMLYTNAVRYVQISYDWTNIALLVYTATDALFVRIFFFIILKENDLFRERKKEKYLEIKLKSCELHF